MTQWHGCYNDSWQGVITPDAFAHPAKFARGLIRRIYHHMLDSGYIAAGDSVVDPFGGVGLGGLDAMTFGLHWTGVELEPRFVELGNRNIEKWRRDLAMLNGTLGTARLVQGDSRRLVEIVGGEIGATVGSPPFETTVNHDGGKADYLDAKNLYSDYADNTPGQLGSMPSGSYSAAVSSSPYGDITNIGERRDPLKSIAAEVRYRDNHPELEGIRPKALEPYGNSEGQLGAMAMGISESPDNFWAAARVIVEQTYQVLKPGGYAAWVAKNFVRKGAIVPFSDQWESLCAAVGFQRVERIHALLVEEHGDQLDIFGGTTARRKERKSFFRRLAEKNGSPRIDHEDVIIMRRPL